MKIITGRTGSAHVTSQQFRMILDGLSGSESCILPVAEKLAAEMSSSNALKIKSGIMFHHGNASCVEIGTYDTVTIQNGTQGQKRIDLVVNRYTKDSSGVEKNAWVCIKGTPSSNPSVPSYTKGDLQNGDATDDCPVFEVHLDGINVTAVKTLLPTMDTFSSYTAEINKKLEKKADTYILGVSVSGQPTGEYLNTKPIYTKMVEIGALPGNTSKTVNTGLSDLDYFWVDPSNSFCFSGGASYPIPYTDPQKSNNGIAVRITGNGANVVVTTGTDWTNYAGIVTIKYTTK